MTQLTFDSVALTQGTEEWRTWRHAGIGSSDAATIMGENPWSNPDNLLHHKRSPLRESRTNAAMARGTALEPEAREHYIATTGHPVTPACLQSREHAWMRASVDGMTAAGSRVVEIKCGESAFRSTRQSRRVPRYLYGQLQHILAVTGLTSVDFWCYAPGRPGLLLEVVRNVSYIQRLVAAESAFWTRVSGAG